MSHFSIRLAALALLAASLAAQAPTTNWFTIYPEDKVDPTGTFGPPAAGAQNTTFTTRAGQNGNAADVMIRVDKADYQGVGQVRNAQGVIVGRVNGFGNVLQDQNAATTEQFYYVIRAEDPANPGKPNPAAGSEILTTAPLTSPSGSGAAAWLITASLATPAEVLPLQGTYFYGVNMASNPAWTADGLSNHAASFTTAPGDMPRANTATITHTVNTVTNTLGAAVSARTMDVYLEVDGGVLNPGQDTTVPPTPVFGYGATYPRNSASGDGCAYYYADISNAGGGAALFLGVGFAPVPIDLGPVFGGAVLINPLGLVQVASGSLSATFGELIQVIAPAGTINTIAGSVNFQAASLGAGGLRLSNAAQVNFG